MSAGMAGVIAAHQGYETLTRIGGYTVDCLGCDWRTFSALMPNEDLLHAAHVAEELAKAGYGNVQEAKAKALREAAKDLASIAYVVPGGAGRAEYESRLAVRRGDTDKWLHARADLIDALADPEGHALVKAIRDRKAGVGRCATNPVAP